jgi:hypothetical protein
MSYFKVDVDIDDIVSALGRSDRRALFQAFQDDGYISEHCVITSDGKVMAPDRIEKSKLAESRDDFNLAFQKLWNNGWKLTREEEEVIIGISNRIV